MDLFRVSSKIGKIVRTIQQLEYVSSPPQNFQESKNQSWKKDFSIFLNFATV